jgi:DNA-binding MarR family transcriptional regulator
VVAARHPTTQQLAAWRRYLETHVRLLDRLDADLRERHDLPLAWYDVLVQLDEVGGERTMGELAQALLVSPSNCTRLVDRMAAAGLVHRRQDAADRRVRHASLTVEGRIALRRAGPTHLAGVRRHFTRYLDGDRAAVVTDLFDRVLASLAGRPR